MTLHEQYILPIHKNRVPATAKEAKEVWKHKIINKNMLNTVSANKTMDYYDKIEIHKGAWEGEELFKSYLTLLMDITDDNELSLFATKELILAIATEIETIQVSNDNYI